MNLKDFKTKSNVKKMNKTPNVLKITGGHLLRHFVSINIANENCQLKPASNRLRKSLFAILNPYLLNCCALDLFAGTGIYGFECISRGAKKVYFVEKNLNTFEQLAKNIKRMTLDKYCNIYYSDAFSFIQKKITKFDVIFIDPPYFLIPTNYFWKKIGDLLSINGIIIYRCRSKVDFILPDIYNIVRSQNYTRSHIFFLKKVWFI